MTDEQWLWLFANEALDADEKFDMLCPSCQHDVTSHKCIRCGKPIRTKDGKFGKGAFVNPNFDPDRFERLSDGTDQQQVQSEGDDELDYDLMEQIIRHQTGEQQEE